MAEKSLVIVESPAKARTINKYLGKEYKVTASVGHIIDLPKSKFGVNIEDGFKPQYIKIRGKEKLIKQLRELAQKSQGVFIATDPDREGEAIAYHISSVLDTPPENIFRVEFNEITKNAVEKAMDSPRAIDMARVYSQQARRVLDRIVGYKVSPVLWDTVYRGLSAGRVQSVALRLICEREKEIRDFKPEEFWTIMAKVQSGQADPFLVKLVKFNNKKIHIPNQEEAEKHSKAIKASSLTISSLVKKEVKRQPSPPFTTSTMQQSASRLLRFSTKRIMGIAQSLYEGVNIPGRGSTGLITYMRTDSTRVSNDALNAVRDYIHNEYGEQFRPEKARFFKTKKSAQDAHEAIRPTYISTELRPEALKDILNKEQFKLYDLIWKRFVASQMTPAIFDKTTVTVSGGIYTLIAEGETLKFAGFTKVYKDNGDAAENGKNAIPSNLIEGADCTLKDLQAEQNFTKAAARFTESTLVRELDSLGIGRPSTYAQIVSTILQRNYVELKERKLHATELGETVASILVNNFPKIFNVSFTAGMEKELDDISDNNISYEKVMDDFYTPFEKALDEVQSKKSQIKLNLQDDAGEACEKCGKPMIVRWGRNGKFMACSGFPGCKNTKPLEEQAEPEMSDETCEKCSSPMVIKRGKFGRFLACSNYPECKNTKPISTGVTCPKDNCSGNIVERQSKRGKIFYGCSKYPDCDFVSWDKPLNRECPSCGNNYMLEKTSKKKGAFIRCPNCKHEITD